MLKFSNKTVDRRQVMSTRIKRICVLIVALVLLVAGCSKKVAPPLSVMDSPEYHYRNGLKYFDSDQLDDALKSFDRAIALDPKFSLAYIGKGLAFGKKSMFKPAFENMSKARGLDHGIEANIGMIRLLSMQHAKDWISDAEDELKSAQKKDPNSARLYYFMGMAYKAALDFDKAANMFKDVLDMNKDFIGEANAEWALIQKIQRAAPGTEIGKKIALIDKIDRADIAALFDQEMNLEKLFTKRGIKSYDTSFKAPKKSSTAMQTEKVIKMDVATDIADQWLKPSIDLVLKLRIRGLEVGPDHTFEPDKLITRSEFALMLEDILTKVSGDKKLATKFLGATSPFPDIRNDQYFFNAAMTAASRGFIEADKATGEFKPGDPVSGADALLSIREFKNQLKF
jgi:tetratricopeptide (TPR) repeat protein